MFIVLSVTNGEGYSSPSVEVFNDFSGAVASYTKHVGYMFNVNRPYEMGSQSPNDEPRPGFYKSLFVSYDEDGDQMDNFGVHMFPVESGDCVTISCNYSDEITVEKEQCPEEFEDVFHEILDEEDEDEIFIKIYIK